MTYVDSNFGTNTSIMSSKARGPKAEAFEAPVGSSSAPGSAARDSESGSTAKLSGALWSLQSGFQADAPSETSEKSPEEEFSELADMSIGDRLMQQYLGEHGLTKEDLASMPADEREKIVEEVRHQVLEAAKQQGHLASQQQGPGGDVSTLGALQGLGQTDVRSGDDDKRDHS